MPRRRLILFVVATVFATTLVGVAANVAGAWTRGSVRIAGNDRYGTAVELSKALFPSGAPAAVVASGLVFPDALVGGPLAARVGGPVLLAQRDGVPGATASELTRLHPTTVYVVGGPSVISDATFLQLAAALPGVSIQRLSGDDRYATAAAVSALFPPGGAAYLANGQAFPDALAGGAAAATAGSPLLLTRPEALPAPIASELARLAPPSGAVLGGTGAVGDVAFSQIAAKIPSIRRLAGPDRYFTAAAVAADQAPASTQVVLATGLDYPDALAAAPMAAKLRAPLLLTSPSCSPPATVQRLGDAGWPDVTIVGGATAVSRSAGLAAPCVPPTGNDIAPGLRFDMYTLPGPQVARVLTVDRNQLDVVTTTSLGRLTGRLPTSEVARRTGALAAVNGDFFVGDGDPVHALAVDGRLFKAPGLVESMLAFDARQPTGSYVGRPSITMSMRLEGPQITFAVNRVNGVAPGPGETVLYTSEGQATITPPSPMCTMTLRPLEAPTVNDAGDTMQRETSQSVICGVDPVALSGADVVMVPEYDPNAAALSALPPGSTVTFTWRLQSAWTGVRSAIGANLTLVRNGVRTPDVTRAGAFYTEKAPRTGVGILADGRLVIVTVDGRQAKYSVGMTVKDFADYLVKLGAVNAVNLDGGGSTAMAIKGVLANRPSDAAGERPIGPALIVVPKGYVLPSPATTTTLPPPPTTTSTTSPGTSTTTSTTIAAQARATSTTPDAAPAATGGVDPMTDDAPTGGWFRPHRSRP
ncbi:MAG: cell wall-binding repeat-containing protein [Acidobacteria bacterium]|nr:cell wall-binding repeat-containing protein [Acidobacteriota bacterium]